MQFFVMEMQSDVLIFNFHNFIFDIPDHYCHVPALSPFVSVYISNHVLLVQ